MQLRSFQICTAVTQYLFQKTAKFTKNTLQRKKVFRNSKTTRAGIEAFKWRVTKYVKISER